MERNIAKTANKKLKSNRPEDNRTITISGRQYTMALGFDDLCDQEHTAFHRWGHHAGLLETHYTPGLISTARNAFAISLERFHPEIPFDDRRALLTWPTLLQVAETIYSIFHPTTNQPKETPA